MQIKLKSKLNNKTQTTNPDSKSADDETLQFCKIKIQINYKTLELPT